MNLSDRLRPMIPMLVMTLIILLVSRVAFDLLGARPMFWNSDEQLKTFLFHCLIGGPFVFFALLVAQQRNQGGK